MDHIAHLNMKNCFYEKNKLPRDASETDLLLTQYIFRDGRDLYISFIRHEVVSRRAYGGSLYKYI